MYKKIVSLIIIFAFVYSDIVWANQTLRQDVGAILTKVSAGADLQGGWEVFSNRDTIFRELIEAISRNISDTEIYKEILFALFQDELKSLEKDKTRIVGVSEGTIKIEVAGRQYELRYDKEEGFVLYKRRNYGLAKRIMAIAIILFMIIGLIPISSNADERAPPEEVQRVITGVDNWLSVISETATGLPPSHVGPGLKGAYTYDLAHLALRYVRTGNYKEAKKIVFYYSKKFNRYDATQFRFKADGNRVYGILRLLRSPSDGEVRKHIINCIDVDDTSDEGRGAVEWYADGGPQSWLGMAAVQLLMFDTGLSSEERKDIVGFVTGLADTILGLFNPETIVSVGPIELAFNDASSRYRIGSVENMWSHYAFLIQLANYFEEQKINPQLVELYRGKAVGILMGLKEKGLLIKEGDIAYFRQGFREDEDGNIAINGQIPTDVQSWGIASAGPRRLNEIFGEGTAEGMLNWIIRHALVMVDYVRPDGSEVTTIGADFSDPRLQDITGQRGGVKPQITDEWTAGVIYAMDVMERYYYETGKVKEADEISVMADALRFFAIVRLTEAPNERRYWLYSTIPDMPTGFGWKTPQAPGGSLSGNQMVFALAGINPFDPSVQFPVSFSAVVNDGIRLLISRMELRQFFSKKRIIRYRETPKKIRESIIPGFIRGDELRLDDPFIYRSLEKHEGQIYIQEGQRDEIITLRAIKEWISAQITFKRYLDLTRNPFLAFKIKVISGAKKLRIYIIDENYIQAMVEKDNRDDIEPKYIDVELTPSDEWVDIRVDLRKSGADIKKVAVIVYSAGTGLGNPVNSEVHIKDDMFVAGEANPGKSGDIFIPDKIPRSKLAGYFITRGIDCALIPEASFGVFTRRYKLKRLAQNSINSSDAVLLGIRLGETLGIDIDPDVFAQRLTEPGNIKQIVLDLAEGGRIDLEIVEKAKDAVYSAGWDISVDYLPKAVLVLAGLLKRKKRKAVGPVDITGAKFTGLPLIEEEVREILDSSDIVDISREELDGLERYLTDMITEGTEYIELPSGFGREIEAKSLDLARSLDELVRDIRDGERIRKRKDRILTQPDIAPYVYGGLMPEKISLREMLRIFRSLKEKGGFKLFIPTVDNIKYLLTLPDQATSAVIVSDNKGLRCCVLRQIWDLIESTVDEGKRKKYKLALLMHEIAEYMILNDDGSKKYLQDLPFDIKIPQTPPLAAHYIGEAVERFILGEEIRLDGKSSLDGVVDKYFNHDRKASQDGEYVIKRLVDRLNEFKEGIPDEVLNNEVRRFIVRGQSSISWTQELTRLYGSLSEKRVRKALEIDEGDIIFIVRLFEFLCGEIPGEGPIEGFKGDKYQFIALLNLYIEKKVQENTFGFLKVNPDKIEKMSRRHFRQGNLLYKKEIVIISDARGDDFIRSLAELFVRKMKETGRMKVNERWLIKTLRLVACNIEEKAPKALHEMLEDLAMHKRIEIVFRPAGYRMEYLFSYNRLEEIIEVNLDALTVFGSPKIVELLIAIGLFGHLLLGYSGDTVDEIFLSRKDVIPSERRDISPEGILKRQDIENIIYLLRPYEISLCEYLWNLCRITNHREGHVRAIMGYMRAHKNQSSGPIRLDEVLIPKMVDKIRGIVFAEEGYIELNVPAAENIEMGDIKRLAKAITEGILWEYANSPLIEEFIGQFTNGISHAISYCLESTTRWKIEWKLSEENIRICFIYPRQNKGNVQTYHHLKEIARCFDRISGDSNGIEEMLIIENKLPSKDIDPDMPLGELLRKANINESTMRNAARIIDKLELKPGDRVLDVGPLQMAEIAVAASVKGADVDVVNLKWEENLGRMMSHRKSFLLRMSRLKPFIRLNLQLPRYYTGRVQDMPLQGSSYKAVFLFNVLDSPHISREGREEILARCLELVKDGGHLFVSFYTPGAVKWLFQNDMEGIRIIAENYGYHLEIAERRGSFIHFIVRRRNRKNIDNKVIEDKIAGLSETIKGERYLNARCSILGDCLRLAYNRWKLRFAIPFEVLENSPDFRLTLERLGQESQIFEMIVYDAEDGLEGDSLAAFLNLPKNIKVNIIGKGELQAPDDPLEKMDILTKYIRERFSIREKEPFMIATNMVTRVDIRDLNQRLNRKSGEPLYNGAAIRIIAKPEGQDVISLSSIISSWLEDPKKVSIVMPVPVTKEDVKRRMEEDLQAIWVLLRAA